MNDAQRAKNLLLQRELLSKLEPTVSRVKVITEFGTESYKDPHEVLDTDQIALNKSGLPITMNSKPGRRSIVKLRPATPVAAEVERRKTKALEQDPILRQVKEGTLDSADILQEVIRGFAEEAALLKFDRSEAARKGEETAPLSSRRLTALRSLADVWLKRMDQMGSKSIDLDSPAFFAVFKVILNAMREAMAASAIPAVQMDTVFSKLSSIVGSDDFKSSASMAMKKAAGG